MTQRHLITDTDGKTVALVTVQGKQVYINLVPGYSIKMSANFDPSGRGDR